MALGILLPFKMYAQLNSEACGLKFGLIGLELAIDPPPPPGGILYTMIF